MGSFFNEVSYIVIWSSSIRISIVFNVKFVSAEAYDTGIGNVASTADKADGKIYDLSGREVRKPARGLYIVNGQKRIVK